MIANIGCDIVRVGRIKRSIDLYGARFLKRIFSDTEIMNAPVHPKKQCVYFANRFAAKEAFAKSLGTGIGESVHFNEIEILNHPSGQPYIKFPERLGKMNVHLSITDEDSYSLAFVVIEKMPKSK
jgi:holo-[acyl-carrier protein] synthase